MIFTNPTIVIFFSYFLDSPVYKPGKESVRMSEVEGSNV